MTKLKEKEFEANIQLIEQQQLKKKKKIKKIKKVKVI